MGTTSEMRAAWHPPCTKRSGLMTQAYSALNAAFQRHNYLVRSGVTGSYNCRRITGGTGYSLHAYLDDGNMFEFASGVKVTKALAVDVNWDKNPYGPRLVTDMPRAMIDEIMAIRTNSGVKVWGWGGYYSSNKDAMHFEIVCTPSQLATGIRGATSVPTPQTPTSTRKCGDPSGHPLLKRGAVGPAVNHLQYLLQRTGSKIAGDGEFGPATESALRNFQTWAKITSDGVCGNQTWSTVHRHVDGLTV